MREKRKSSYMDPPLTSLSNRISSGKFSPSPAYGDFNYSKWRGDVEKIKNTCTEKRKHYSWMGIKKVNNSLRPKYYYN